MSKKYSRYFLIFNEEDTGFEFASDKQPTGYTKIETKKGKCKITVYAQNLKVEKGPYVGYLVDSSKNPAIVAKLGEISIDKNGKGETVWEQDAKDIFGTGLSADNFNVAAVVREGNRLQVPLAGYSGKDKVQWREKITSRSFVREGDNAEEEKPNDTIRENTNTTIEEEIEKTVSSSISETPDEDTSDTREDSNKLIQEDLDYEEVQDSIEGERSTMPPIDGGEDLGNNNQLQREDRDYIDNYSEEGIKFKHYESEINLQDDNSTYAENTTKEESEEWDFDIPEINKDNFSQIEDETRGTEEEDILCDGRDIQNQRSEEKTILNKALDNMNINRNKLCKSLKTDLEKLDKEIEKEVKACLNKALEKYKKTILNKVCDEDHNKHHHHDHCDKKKSHKDDCHKKDDKCHKKDKGHHCSHQDENKFDIKGFVFKDSNPIDNKLCDEKQNQKAKGYSKSFHRVLDGFEEINVESLKDCRFWKVEEQAKFPSKENSAYPYYSAIFHLRMTYPYINYVKYFKNKGYYYFGVKYDRSGEVKYLVYGIEGDRKENHQPYKGMTGFVNWVPHEKSGIWLMYYNPYTGCVMLPKGKEKDKDK